jgi:hypothetical protein
MEEKRMDWTKFTTLVFLALVVGLFGAGCSEDEKSAYPGGSQGGNNNNDDDDDDDEVEIDSSLDTSTPDDVKVWPCPVENWSEYYACVSSEDACDGMGGVTSDNYVCEEGSGGTICCDMTIQIVEGTDPCPVEEEGISCQASWECYKATMSVDNLLYEDYFCEGDNQLCCDSLLLDGLQPDAGLMDDDDNDDDDGADDEQ